MTRILICLAMAGLVLTSVAFAQDSQWGDDPVISNDAVDEADDTPAEVTAPASTEAHQPISPDAMGMYFGLDGDLRQRSASLTETGRTVDYHGQQVIFPEYGRGAYSTENVYGPMWGVPGEAVGLEGYDPYYYYVLSGGDLSQLTAEQRREMEERMKSAGVVAAGPGPGHTYTSSDTEVVDAADGGIDLIDDYWD